MTTLAVKLPTFAPVAEENTVIVALPAAFAFTRPSELTDATAGLEET